MSTSADMTVQRREIVVEGITLSYLHAGAGRPMLLVHGTFWSRVWEPVLPELAAAGYAVFAFDFPGFGASGGRLTRHDATVPELAQWGRRFLDAVEVTGPLSVGGHDIGGAVAQHLAAADPSVERLILMNSVLYDSWPVPAVKRFRDPAVADAVTVPELLEARAQSLGKAISRPLDDAERSAWLAPWRDQQRVRSWTAMAGAADARYTLDLIARLRERALPTLLIWGEDDEFRPVGFAERYAAEMPGVTLTRVPGARHIPTADEPALVAAALTRFLADASPDQTRDGSDG